MRGFVGGLELSGLFYEEAVQPILDSEFPGLPHLAVLIGHGSEVLGYDAPRSTDHEWGPRLLLFLSEEDHRKYAARVSEVLRHGLPGEIGGHPTHFGEPDAEVARVPERSTSAPVEHKVERTPQQDGGGRFAGPQDPPERREAQARGSLG